MVTFSFPFAANSGRYFTTGSSNARLRCFRELHHRGCGDEALRQRRHVEDRAFGHGLNLGFERALAICMLKYGLPTVVKVHYRAGELFGRNRLIDRSGNCSELILLLRRGGAMMGRGWSFFCVATGRQQGRAGSARTIPATRVNLVI